MAIRLNENAEVVALIKQGLKPVRFPYVNLVDGKQRRAVVLLKHVFRSDGDRLCFLFPSVYDNQFTRFKNHFDLVRANGESVGRVKGKCSDCTYPNADFRLTARNDDLVVISTL